MCVHDLEGGLNKPLEKMVADLVFWGRLRSAALCYSGGHVEASQKIASFS